MGGLVDSSETVTLNSDAYSLRSWSYRGDQMGSLMNSQQRCPNHHERCHLVR